jgi:hypothetical protein
MAIERASGMSPWWQFERRSSVLQRDTAVGRRDIDRGADSEAPAGSIADRWPLDNAVGYGCWRVARLPDLLFTRGAHVNWISESAVGTPLDQASGRDTGRAALLAGIREHGVARADYT